MRLIYLSLVVAISLSLPAFGAVEPRLAGTWTMKSADGRVVTFQLKVNGSYIKTSGVGTVETGSIEAINGKWKTTASSGSSEDGTFSIIGDQLILRSNLSPTTKWRRGSTNPPQIKKISNNTQEPENRAASRPSSTPLPASPLKPVRSEAQSKNPYANFANKQALSTPHPAPPGQPTPSTHPPKALSSSPATRPFPRGFQGMAPNKGQRVGTPWGLPGRSGSSGGFSGLLGGLVNAAKGYAINKAAPSVPQNASASGRAYSNELDAAANPAIHASKNPALNQPAGATIDPRTIPGINLATAPPRIPANYTGVDEKGVAYTETQVPDKFVNWQVQGNWERVAKDGKHLRLHFMSDGRYYMTGDFRHLEGGTCRALNNQFSIHSQKGKNVSGTYTVNETQLVLKTPSGPKTWRRFTPQNKKAMKRTYHYKPARSGFSAFYNGSAEFHGGGLVKFYKKGEVRSKGQWLRQN